MHLFYFILFYFILFSLLKSLKNLKFSYSKFSQIKDNLAFPGRKTLFFCEDVKQDNSSTFFSSSSILITLILSRIFSIEQFFKILQ